MFFENLPNEILIEIFSFIEMSQLHRAFSSLNNRFEILLNVRSVRLWARPDVSSFDFVVQRSSSIDRLELINWPSIDVLKLFHTNSFDHLTSLRIDSSALSYYGLVSHELIHRILPMKSLSFCRFHWNVTIYLRFWTFPTSLSIRSLNLKSIPLDSLLHLLLFVPQLRILKVWLSSSREGRLFSTVVVQPSTLRHEKLRQLTIYPEDNLHFNEIFSFLSHFPMLKSLKLLGSSPKSDFLNISNWKKLLLGENISSRLSFLFVQLEIRCYDEQMSMDEIFHQFHHDEICRKHLKLTNFDSNQIRIDCHSIFH